MLEVLQEIRERRGLKAERVFLTSLFELQGDFLRSISFTADSA